MAITLEQIRQQYPQYNHLSDEDLATRLHQKFYSGMPQEEFFSRVGLGQQVPMQEQEAEQQQNLPSAFARYPLAILQGMTNVGKNIGDFPFKLMGMKTSQPIDIRSALGMQYQPTAGENLTQLAAEEAPGFILPETKLFGAVEKLRGIPKFGKYLGEVAAKGVPFGAYQATQEESPIKGFAEGLGGYAAGLGAIKGVKGALKGAKLAVRPVDVEDTYGVIQEAYNKKNKELGDMFKYVSQEMKNRGVANVGQIDKDFIKDAKEILPSTKTNRILLDKVEQGNYDDIRKLYTKVGKKIRTAKDDDVRELYLDLRDRINNGLTRHAEKTGQTDLSDILNQTKSGYANLKKTYESHPVLKNLVGEKQEVPETLKPLMKNNAAMQRIRQMHPEVEKDIAATNVRKNLKRLGIGAALVKGYQKITRD